MKRSFWVAAGVIIVAVIAATYYYTRDVKAEAPAFSTAEVSRGDVISTVEATGTLEAVTTVQVGSQVSGTISALHADFNSEVKKGQVIAELDSSLFQTQVEQARATVARLQADFERAKVQAADADPQAHTRARALRQAADPEDGSRNRGEHGPLGGCCGERRRSGNRPGEGVAQPGAGQPQSHDHQGTHRWRGDRAQRGRRTDGRVEPAGADAVHPRPRSRPRCR